MKGKSRDPKPDPPWRKKLILALADRGLTQYRLAAETGIRQSRLSLWLNGTGEPGLEEWVKISKALDIPLAWFADDRADPPPECRSPEEQMLVRVARKVGIVSIWGLIASVAIERWPGSGSSAGATDPPARPVGPIPPVRDIVSREAGAEGDPGGEDEDGKGGRRRPRRKG